MTFPVARLADPYFFKENRMDPHSDHRWFASPAEEKSGTSRFEQSLNGTWKFHYAPNPQSVPEGFEAPSYDTNAWVDIEVPGHIQMQGYDRNQYVNTQYPWDGHEQIWPPQVPTKYNPVAVYVKNFTLDREPTEGERVSIVFEGAESAVALWLNGQYIGYAEDTFTPSEFDITGALIPGENKLAAQVFKWTSASWVEDQDFFRFSGIFRDVVLRTRPKVHVEDITVTTDIADDHSSATIRVGLDLEGEGTAKVMMASGSASAEVMMASGSASAEGAFVETEPGSFEMTIDNPRLWSAENPDLYDLHITVQGPSGGATEFIPLRVGIRRFAIEDGLMKINGKRVVLRGVNRHEFGINGRVVTYEETKRDLILLKRLGVNAIRTAHYPNNRYFYELADFYGFYVIDEMNFESHGIWAINRHFDADIEDIIPGNHPEWLPLMLDRAGNMLEREKNHPSIIMWSLGNESFGGKDFLDVANFLRDNDDRPVHYEGVSWDDRYPDATDVYSQMYTPAGEVAKFLQENREKPMILCEYAHSMGNSFGAVDKYVDLAYEEPLYQGGFIWDFSDQALLMKDRFGVPFHGYGGDSGESPHDQEFCGNGIFFLDRTPTPKAQEVKDLYQAIKIDVHPLLGTFTVTNRFDFTGASNYNCVVTLAEQGRVISSRTVQTDVAPGQEATYRLPFRLPSEAGEYTVDVSFTLAEDTSWADAGYEVASGQGVVAIDAAAADFDHGDLPAPTVVQGIHNIGVHGEHFSAIFSRILGGLVAYHYGEDPRASSNMLKAIPMPNFWHAPTSNEKAWGGPGEDGQWLLASRYAKFVETPTNPSFETRGGRAVITYDYSLPTVPASAAQVEYAVDATGHVQITLFVDPGEGLGDMPEFGMLFKADADLENLVWYGEGPAEAHVDRRKGARLGVYDQQVSKELTPYLKPQESGSHTGVRWAQVTGDDGLGFLFDYSATLQSEAEGPNPTKPSNWPAGMEFSALNWSPFEVENAAHHNELPPRLYTYLRPALMRRGVAGDDTWGARAHPEYLLPAGRKLAFSFGFRGVEV